MKKFMKVVWTINSVISIGALVMSVGALLYDKKGDAVNTNLYIFLICWFSTLLSLTFVAILEDKK